MRRESSASGKCGRSSGIRERECSRRQIACRIRHAISSREAAGLFLRRLEKRVDAAARWERCLPFAEGRGYEGPGAWRNARHERGAGARRGAAIPASPSGTWRPWRIFLSGAIHYWNCGGRVKKIAAIVGVIICFSVDIACSAAAEHCYSPYCSFYPPWCGCPFPQGEAVRSSETSNLKNLRLYTMTVLRERIDRLNKTLEAAKDQAERDSITEELGIAQLSLQWVESKQFASR